MTFGAELQNTEYTRVALAFTHSLCVGDFENARDMLTEELKVKWPLERMTQLFKRTVHYWDGPVLKIEANEGYDDYPNKPPDDIGGVYIEVLGDGYNGALMIFVRRERNGPRIREIIWGKP